MFLDKSEDVLGNSAKNYGGTIMLMVRKEESLLGSVTASSDFDEEVNNSFQ
jgi:hypothetical protein